jgi:hypothetical protein
MENVGPYTIVAELAVDVPAQFFEMEGCHISVNDEGGAGNIVEVFWLYDDHRLEKLVVMKLDRPIGQEFDDRCGNTVALLRPQRFVGTCGTVLR